MSRSKIEERTRLVWLDLLRGPWNDDGREFTRARLEKLGISHQRFYGDLSRPPWNWEGSFTTLGRILRGGYWDGDGEWRESKPDSDELQLFAAVLASYPGNWPKASNLSSPETAYSFWPERALIPA